MFNLTAYYEDGVIVVRTLDDYYEDGKYYDISKYINSDKVNISKTVLYNKIDLTYGGNKSFAVEASNSLTGDQFGNERVDHHSEDIGSNLAFDGNGKYEVQLPLEKMMFERMTDQDNEDVLTDVQWGWMANEDSNPMKGKPLLFYVHKKRNGTQFRFSFIDGGTSVMKDDYIIPSNLVDVNDSDSQTLHWGSEVNEYTGEFASESLFKNYYRNYINFIYDRQSRLFNMEGILPTSLMHKLKPNDKFVINNKIYRINSLDTSLITGKSKFELVNEINEIPIATEVEVNENTGGDINDGAEDTDTGIDTVRPTVTITSGDVSHLGITMDSKVKFDITVSESVTTLDINDFSVGNGVLTNFTGSGTTYSVDLEPITDGSCSIQLAEDAFTDATGNGNSQSNIFIFTKSTATSSSGPTVGITVAGSTVTNGGTTSDSSHTFQFTLSEAAGNGTTFGIGDITTSFGVLKALLVENNSTSYTCELTAVVAGTYTVKIEGGVFQNASGDDNEASDVFTWTKI